MDMDMMFREDEQMLYRFRLPLSTVLRKGLLNKSLVFLIFGLPLMIPCIVFACSVFCVGLERLVPLLVFLWPLWIYLIFCVQQIRLYASTEYCVTTRGVYRKTGEKEQIKFVPYTQMYEIRSDPETPDTGTVTCILKVHNGLNKGSEFVMESIPDYQFVKAEMEQQLDRCLAESKQQELEKKLPAPSEEQRAAIRDMLSDENVEVLQTELFGANPELQGAFADPTVNSLPELPEEQTLQRGE